MTEEAWEAGVKGEMWSVCLWKAIVFMEAMESDQAAGQRQWLGTAHEPSSTKNTSGGPNRGFPAKKGKREMIPIPPPISL